MRVKICGITNLDDAQLAVDAGADALGFVFFTGSPRGVTVGVAAGIMGRLPPLVAKVGVFVDAPESVIRRTCQECGLDTLQLHGRETPEFCRLFELPVIKAFRFQQASALQELPNYATAAWLLDSYVPGQSGGTGAVFNWDWAVAAGKLGRPIILAGGLTPENVAAAIRQVQPYAVDVSSGVEAAPGRKDPAKVRGFIGAARA